MTEFTADQLRIIADTIDREGVETVDLTDARCVVCGVDAELHATGNAVWCTTCHPLVTA